MGYQVVSVRLRDGKKLYNVTIAGGAIVEPGPAVEHLFREDDIQETFLSHLGWK